MTARLLLASQSASRARLLDIAGVRYLQVRPPYTDPPQPREEGPATAIAELLARRKAASVAALARPSDVILAGDTICISDRGALIGTPRNNTEARDTLGQLLGRSHDVVSAFAVLSPESTYQGYGEARVELDLPSREWTAQYLLSGVWRGKAGGYDLADLQQAGLVRQLSGDPSVPLGFPMDALLDVLRSLGLA